MPWQLWLIFGGPSVLVLLCLFLLRGVSRSLTEEPGAGLDATRAWDEWVDRHTFVDSDPAPRLRRQP